MFPRYLFTGFAKLEGTVSVNHFRLVCLFPEEIRFCTDMIVSIEKLNLVPRLRTGDCFEIHILH